MHVVLFIVGGLALLIAFICLMAGAAEQSLLRPFYFYSAVSMSLGGILFLGLGRGLMLLEQLILNTRSLHDLLANAKSKMVATESRTGASQNAGAVEQGVYEGYKWELRPDGALYTVMDGSIRQFATKDEFARYVRIKGPAQSA